SVELADQIEQSRSGGFEMGRQLGDLVAESLQLRDGFGRGKEHRLIGEQHGGRLSSTLHPRVETAVQGQCQAIAAGAMIFRWGGDVLPPGGRARAREWPKHSPRA